MRASQPASGFDRGSLQDLPTDGRLLPQPGCRATTRPATKPAPTSSSGMKNQWHGFAFDRSHGLRDLAMMQATSSRRRGWHDAAYVWGHSTLFSASQTLSNAVFPLLLDRLLHDVLRWRAPESFLHGVSHHVSFGQLARAKRQTVPLASFCQLRRACSIPSPVRQQAMSRAVEDPGTGPPDMTLGGRIVTDLIPAKGGSPGTATSLAKVPRKV